MQLQFLLLLLQLLLLLLQPSSKAAGYSSKPLVSKAQLL